MKYLLDTCAISEVIKPKPNINFMSWFDAQQENTLFISSLTIGEIYKGIYKLQDMKKQNQIKKWLEEDLVIRFKSRILSIDNAVMNNWGYITAKNEKKGTSLAVMDSLIAATAITYQLSVVTRNVKDIKHMGGLVLNPWE